MVRESLSKCLFRATTALASSESLTKCVLDVADDGVGPVTIMARRLGEGHIGLASHRLRMPVSFGFPGHPRGTHVCVEPPLKR